MFNCNIHFKIFYDIQLINAHKLYLIYFYLSVGLPFSL